MEILYLLDSLNRGGTETLVLDVCRNAAGGRIDLTFAASGGGNLAGEFAASGAPMICFDRQLPIDPRLIWRLRGVIRNKQIQIVHAHQAVEGLHAYFAALGTGARVVLSFHGGQVDAKNRRALQFLLPRTAKNVFVSEALRLWYAAEHNLNIELNSTVLHNGVDARRLMPNNANLRRELGIGADSFVIGMIGNFYAAPRKDQLTLVRALPRFFGENQNAFCLFVGGVEAGAENKFAECVRFVNERGMGERVKFLGVRADVPNILAALDVFALSTLHEGLPIAVLEAMLANVPCVLSDIAPNLEVSGGGKFAEIFPVQNADVLSRKLLGLAADETRRNELAAAARQFADANFSIAAHLQKLEKLYAAIIESAK